MIPESLGDEAVDITRDIFTALIDREEGHLQLSPTGPAEYAQPLWSWVQMEDENRILAVLGTDKSTAQDMARALFSLDADDELLDTELADAYGEVVNVIGGNLKALVAESGMLTLPTVSVHPPQTEQATSCALKDLQWRGKPVTLQLWSLCGTDENTENIETENSESKGKGGRL